MVVLRLAVSHRLPHSVAALASAIVFLFVLGVGANASAASGLWGSALYSRDSCRDQVAKPLKQYKNVLPNGAICRCTPIIRRSRSRVRKICPCREDTSCTSAARGGKAGAVPRRTWRRPPLYR